MNNPTASSNLGSAPDFGRLTDKVAVVTGAGTGIGRAAALSFAREGAAVVLAGRRRAELQSVESEIAAAGGRASAIPTDVSKENEVAALVQGALKRFGRLDFAFNNAGVTAYKPIEQLTADDFDAVMSTNVRGVWLLVKHEIQAMRAGSRGGAIVNTSSIAATRGTAGLSAYAASKGALDAMIRAIALEVGPQGIRINNVSPGVIRTPMNAGIPEDALAQNRRARSAETIGRAPLMSAMWPMVVYGGSPIHHRPEPAGRWWLQYCRSPVGRGDCM